MFAADPLPSMQATIDAYKQQQAVAAKAVDTAAAEVEKLRQSRGGLGHWEHKRNRAQKKLNQAKKRKVAAEAELLAAQEKLDKCKEEVASAQTQFDEAQATYIEKAKAVGAPQQSEQSEEQLAGKGGSTPAQPITFQDLHRLLAGGDDLGLGGSPELLAQIRGIMGTAVARMAAAIPALPAGGVPEAEEEQEQQSPRLDSDHGEQEQEKDPEGDERPERDGDTRERSRSPRGGGGK
jgi:hypothetical protein